MGLRECSKVFLTFRQVVAPLVQTLPGYMKASIDSLSFEKQKSYTIYLKKNTVLQVDKTVFHEEKGMRVLLQPFDKR
ncbi:MAG: hypothetical protein ABF651_08050 [Sporolactobacillus sp.]